VIGIGCRFPGGINSPETFWRILTDGIDVVGEIPEGRWKNPDYFHPDPLQPGKIYTRAGAFLDGIDLFDADFFGISPREASRVDPQQRLLLEVAWEALDDAGQPVDRLAGTRTGVFIGLCNDEYQDLQYEDPRSINAYTNTGGSPSIAANRLSHAFDLRGPSIVVDTACSSSLVAVHLACQSLRSDESTLALAGGASLMLRPEAGVGYCKASMISPTGRCRSFDARADGYVRGEGAGVVVLKRLSHAVADGDPIYAVILASGINQDGHTPGISLPSSAAQQALLEAVYDRAGIEPARVQYVEAHGTGTPAGDPIECEALGMVVGRRPLGSVCRIGSLKTNIGHLEAAAGVAGLIKLSLAIKHRQIPASLHFQTPNPSIDFEGLRLRVQQATEPWPDEGDAIGGVTSFGFGGTNAHAVLKSYTAAQARGGVNSAGPTGFLLPISARNPRALEALAKAYRTLLGAKESPELREVCYTASVRRSHHEHRLAVAAASKEQIVASLEAFLGGERRTGIAVGRKPAARHPKLAFIFSGNGPQWWGMARQLLEREPVFAEVIGACDRALQPYAGWSLLEELSAGETVSRMHRTDIAQPALFAIQLGLSALWRSWGAEPDGVAGHSVGEVAAASVAGVLGFEDAIRVIFHRSRTQEATAGKGSMAAVGLAPEQAEQLLADFNGRLSIAAVNAPTAVTLTGDTGAVQEAVRVLERKGVFCRVLRLNYPFHSHHMDPVKEDLLDSLRNITPRDATVRFVSSVTAGPLQGRECTASYWWDNIRQPVVFAGAIDRLLRDGFTLFLEIGPHPVLAGYISECASEQGKTIVTAPSLRRNEEDVPTMLGALGSLYAAGYPVSWDRLYPHGGQVVRMPSYPWQRDRHWNQPQDRSLLQAGPAHPLLGVRVETSVLLWHGELDRTVVRFLDDHRVQRSVVFPATGYVEMALAAAGQIFGAGSCGVEDLQIRDALVLPDNRLVQVQTMVAPDWSFTISSRPGPGSHEWKTHATGQLIHPRPVIPTGRCALADVRLHCPGETTGEEHYRSAHARNMQYGRCFQGVTHIWSGDAEAVGRIEVKDDIRPELPLYGSHPALLDACIQVLLRTVPPGSSELTYLPVSIDRVLRYQRLDSQVYAHVRLVEQAVDYLVVDCSVFTEDGTQAAHIQGLRLKTVNLGVSDDYALDKWLYRLQWKPQPLPGSKGRVRDAKYLPAPRWLARCLGPRAAQLSDELAMQRYYDVQEPIRKLNAAYIVDAFRKLGWDARPGDGISRPELWHRWGVPPRYDRLMDVFLEMLGDEGLLRRTAGEWEICPWPRTADPHSLWRRLVSELPGYQAELHLLGRCGSNLGGVLTEKIDPLGLIFAEKSGVAESLYDTAPTFRLYNALLAEVVAQAIRRLPSRATIRVLEIGAGTGGSTGHLLPRFPGDRTTYVFTDLSNAFLIGAEQRFRSFPFVEYRTLDIEHDPIAQGFEPHSFDLIFASDVLHATRDLRESLAHVHQLLASEGLLVLLEISRTSRWLDLVFGLLKGWWQFSDVSIRRHPLLTRHQWIDLLENSGFPEVSSLADEPPGVEPLHSILLARGPRIESHAQAPIVPPAAKGRWAIFGDSTGLGEALCRRLKMLGSNVVLVEPGSSFRQVEDRFTIDPQARDDMDQLIRSLAGAEDPCVGVVYCWSLDAIVEDQSPASTVEVTEDLVCLSVIHLVQAITETSGIGTPRLWLVTSGAQAGHGQTGVSNVAQSPLWGLGRTIMREHPDLHCTLVDVTAPRVGTQDPAYSEVELRNLVAEFLGADDEEEILLQDNARYVHKVTPMALTTCGQAPPLAAQPTASFRLESAAPGLLERLVFRPVLRQQPAEDEVAIDVRAAGLNFRDVMQALGLLSGLPLGSECAGKVVAVGGGVNQIGVGDEVIAYAPHCFSPYVVARQQAVAIKPSELTFDEAVTIPAVFLTAQYALRQLGHIGAGERVLIHAGAGGVGLAAIQVARRYGAEVLSTAGSREKRDFLRSLGVAHVMDSRSLAFADEVLAITKGEGVDLVLNSLAGEAIGKGLSVLKRFGRFLEIGKRDVLESSRLNLRPFWKCLSFHTVDLDQLLRHDPNQIQSLFQDVLEGIRQGYYRPLPYRVFSIRRCEEAFRCMQQSRHIGKLVISLEDTENVVRHPHEEPVQFREDATYLITGGLGGVGLALARWMIRHGARHLVLAGRRGAESLERQAAIDQLKTTGAELMVVALDVANETQLGGVLADISRKMPPLRGIFHLALLLDDGIILQLNRDRLSKVMAPKVAGAWNLHRQTLECPLDHFVLFSSFTSILGNAGQANYAAASAFLDGLAHYRRGQGRPALTVNWGALGDVGYVARHSDIGQRLLRQGVRPIRIETALAMLGKLLVADLPQAGILDIDWSRWLQHNVIVPSKFSDLGDRLSQGRANEDVDNFSRPPQADGPQLLESRICAHVAVVLGKSPANIPLDRGITSLGLDSLMAVDLRIRIERDIGVDVPVIHLMQGHSVADLAAYVTDRLAAQTSANGDRQPHASPKGVTETTAT
jgi:acyl transferase domain-containing protein/NADPH:quinone reductase-like Zn-dependent oxidoreductase/SAM-dependent methyltransferase/acyl carrier protein